MQQRQSLSFLPPIGIENLTKTGIYALHCYIGQYMLKSGLAETPIMFLNTKQIRYSETKEVVNELQGYGITVIGSFIIGNPGDTREIIYENFQKANDMNIDIPLFLILTPLPKTEIREELIKNKLITNSDDFAKYDLFHANVKTQYLTSRDLERIRDEIAFKILKNGSRFWKLVNKYPKFSTKLLFDQLIHQPREVFGYVRGFFK